uniref:Uncharacterized protein n=1 Tax=Strigops habroptila TaxID=2489341 RepID=A0A672UT90_STRHB
SLLFPYTVRYTHSPAATTIFFREDCSHASHLQLSRLKCWHWAPWSRATNAGCGALVAHY